MFSCSGMLEQRGRAHGNQDGNGGAAALSGCQWKHSRAAAAPRQVRQIERFENVGRRGAGRGNREQHCEDGQPAAARQHGTHLRKRGALHSVMSRAMQDGSTIARPCGSASISWGASGWRRLLGGTGFQPVCLYSHRLEAGATQQSSSISASTRESRYTQTWRFNEHSSFSAVPPNAVSRHFLDMRMRQWNTLPVGSRLIGLWAFAYNRSVASKHAEAVMSRSEKWIVAGVQ